MASGNIPRDYSATLLYNATTLITDFNFSHTEVAPIIGIWNGSTLNKPAGAYVGFFIHISSSNNFATQIAVNIDGGNKIYIRNKMSGTWNEWKTFTAS